MFNPEYLHSNIEAYLQQVNHDLTEFKERFSVEIIVSISGGAEDHNLGYARGAISQLLDGLKNSHCAILSGGTQGGIPELSTKLAKENNIPTIAVYPPKAKKYVLFDEIDFPIETLPPSIGPASFGSETPTFAQLPDYAVFIGGSYGTLIEVSTMMKITVKRQKDNLSQIYICPLTGSGGVAELIPELAQLNPPLLSCLPDSILSTGSDIASFISNSRKKK